MPFPRSSGILLHPTSLPSRFGIGDLGPRAYEFVNFLAETGQQLWQILPLGPTGFGNSPYLCYSAMAGNPLLISLERLRDDGLLDDKDLDSLPDFPEDSVDYERVDKTKMPMLRRSCENFKNNATPEQQQEFQQFCDRASYWIDDYALFISLKEIHDLASWHQWPDELSKRQPEAMERCRRQLNGEIFFRKYLQFEFYRQWSALKRYANDRQIKIMGDIPFYVAHDSADVWAHPSNFCLDAETGEPSIMAGVPPDYFSETGQLWGNPVYKWERLQQEEFEWWVQRFKTMLDYVDIIRIDHFRGFRAYWAVPGGDTTAMGGDWVEAPGEEFFELLDRKLGKLPIVAEDLGVITPDVDALRERFEFPGMKILHFAFDSGRENPYLPYNYHSPNFVVYTGTHDNNTTVGWYDRRSDEERERVWRYLGCTTGSGIEWDLIRLALSSVANQAMFPLQDILGLGEDARMNRPSQAEGNWSWRYRAEALTQERRDRLKALTEIYGRNP